MKLQNLEVSELTTKEAQMIEGGKMNWVMVVLFGPLYTIPYHIGKYA